jgi:quercetin dioxygenase-like cupin family protein
VLDGELTFQLGDDVVRAARNTFVFAPADAIHTLANHSDTPARYLLLCAPAGFERRFEDDSNVPETIVVGGPIEPRDHAPRLDPAGDTITILRRGGLFSVTETNPAAGFAGPRPHHHAFAELFYVLDGQLTLELGPDQITRGSGELAYVPGGAVHTYTNPGDTPARCLIVCTPAGFEAHFARIAARRNGVEPPEWALGPLPEVTVV